jgi:pimeloyl-ACP methyl ester carboxylesterase
MFKLHAIQATHGDCLDGAVWAYLYAAEHPDKVARLVAADSGLGAPLFQTELLEPLRPERPRGGPERARIDSIRV